MNPDAFKFVASRNGSSNWASLESAELIPAQRILVADDDPIICWLISDFLVEDDFEVIAVSDGEQAWEALHHGHYDLLITGDEMSGVTGIKLIERIRNAGMTLPVIMASATFSEENARNYPRLHIDAVVSKPFGKLELLSVVRTTLSHEVNITMPASLYPIL